MKRRRKQMPPIEIEGVEHRCGNACFWPPLEIECLGGSAEDLRYAVPDVVYQRLKTWERVCGLMEMSPSKCPSCPLLVVGGKPVKEPGTGKARQIINRRTIWLAGRKP